MLMIEWSQVLEREREKRNITEMDRESTRRQAFSVVMPFECAPYY